MKVFLLPLYSKVSPGLGNCPLGCQTSCRVIDAAPTFELEIGCTCPLSVHQAETYVEATEGSADVIFNGAATGDGKSLAAFLPSLLSNNIRIMGLYPTIELVEDQTRSQRAYHQQFGLTDTRIDRLFGEELSRRVQENDSNRVQELRIAIESKSIILTNPDIFHLITHFQYRAPAYDNTLVPLLLAEFPDLWVFDEFHIFGAHQEAAVLNSLSFIRRSQQRKRRFLFTSATPKEKFIQQLQSAGFQTKIITGTYASSDQPGYRQVLQPVELEFVQLKGQDVLDWLMSRAAEIHAALTTESLGRGLIILNSVAQAGRVVRRLKTLLPDVEVREISGRMDRTVRQETQEKLRNSEQPVLVVGTSAVDVGVDFKIHLLIFESSNSATVIQRLGRLGRHAGFTNYKAIALLPEHAPWILSRLREVLAADSSIDREILRDAIIDAFDQPAEFEEYCREWGALQAQGMLQRMSQDNWKVMATVHDRILQDLQPLYGSKLDSAKKYWYQLDRDPHPIAKVIQAELLRFRGSTTLEAAVWDEDRFYTYDLLRLLPYTWVEVLEESEFLEAAQKQGHHAFSFQHAQVHLKVQRWVDERIDLRLRCSRDSSELQCCGLILLSRLKIENHPQSDVINCLSRKQILGFLVPVDGRNAASHWQVSQILKLGALFGLYRLTDSSEQTYACAFNQDALLLKALSWRLKKLCRKSTASLFF